MLFALVACDVADVRRADDLLEPKQGVPSVDDQLLLVDVVPSGQYQRLGVTQSLGRAAARDRFAWKTSSCRGLFHRLAVDPAFRLARDHGLRSPAPLTSCC